ncbi:hypothetical protein SCHPADRAFT_892524 [Schizopora paradoxa]|uniref:Uncharacterized protein n=1 Tax=Schizopora paradoxa TaxID=27342 RepID=A0A0H2RLA5_9AGAM|nr:hypothetical protein SCHPADRAFT_892524 [Schizopora paradoxa]
MSVPMNVLPLKTTLEHLQFQQNWPDNYKDVHLFETLRVNSLKLRQSDGLRCIIWEAWRANDGDKRAMLTICEANFQVKKEKGAVYLEARIVVDGDYTQPEHIAQCTIYGTTRKEFKRFLTDNLEVFEEFHRPKLHC